MNFEPGQILEHTYDWRQGIAAKNKYIMLGTVCGRKVGRTGRNNPITRFKLYCCEGHPEYVGTVVYFAVHAIQPVSI